ncbi:LysR family transcriptional regulator [Brevibacillus fulvus]|uniref:DNA-binding transcriptional LysR family regulator n=1 Tax=Brevibacillus fulvus TaxID=1125967 RepID=A0A939BNE3_9BACL|nr:LysR family transcriptional regulator [Brevibacillus fulvus]MBM7588915.1 DNA-binding transcriptional LysR family regulator [Brevibacillus fulvus]
MDERDWLMLKVLFEKKNITKAAQSLYISQPTLTKRLQQIEKKFDVILVQRGTKGIQFTPQGEFLAKCAEEMLQRLRQIRETVDNMAQEVRGTLRLGVSNYFTRHKLPKLLKQFQQRFPQVEYQVITGWSHDVYQLVYNREVHVGIVRGDYSWSDGKQLLFEEHICVASKEKIELADLPARPRIEYEKDLLMKAMIDDWWHEMFSQPPYIAMEVDKSDTCKEMVVNGLGYAILASVLLNQHDQLYQIRLTDRAGEPIVRRTWMLYQQQSRQLKMVDEFVRFVGQVDFVHDL